jgi:uncharacterized protein (DUF1684 family)
MKNLNKTTGLALLFLLQAVLVFAQTNELSADYKKEITAFFDKRDKDLRAPSSPLNLIGMLWLEQGENSFGSGEKNKLVVPVPGFPEIAGSYYVEGRKVTARFDERSGVLLDGKAAGENLNVYTGKGPVSLERGAVHWFVQDSGGELAIRLLNNESENQAKFKGVERFPVDEKWRVKAHFKPYASNSTIPITTIFGKTNERAAAGLLEFEIGGKPYKLEALDKGNGGLFIVFSDQLGGKETYAFRFLNAEKPGSDGSVIVDFNKATNPNCAFSVYAPCPLPPKQNKFTIAIPAGEKKYTLESI